VDRGRCGSWVEDKIASGPSPNPYPSLTSNSHNHGSKRSFITLARWIPTFDKEKTTTATGRGPLDKFSKAETKANTQDTRPKRRRGGTRTPYGSGRSVCYSYQCMHAANVELLMCNCLAWRSGTPLLPHQVHSRPKSVIRHLQSNQWDKHHPLGELTNMECERFLLPGGHPVNRHRHPYPPLPIPTGG